MVIWWILAGLIAGIISADVLHSPALGLSLVVVIGVIYAVNKPLIKKAAVIAIAAALGLTLTLLRLGLLYDASQLYGHSLRVTVQSSKVIHRVDGFTAWEGTVVEPVDLAGSRILVYSEDFHHGIYHLSGRLYPPVQYRNPGQGWHYKRKLYSGEIGVMNRPLVLSFKPVQPGWIQLNRDNYRNNLIANLGEGDGSQLALAVTTGDRSLLSSELKEAVSGSGVGHIMALSGIHVSILAGIILAVLKRIGLSRNLAGVISVGFLMGYVIFVGPAASLIRAVLMSVYAMAAVISGRESHGLPALLWTCFIMLLFNPLWIFDYAFVYSFLATLACLTAGSGLVKYLFFLPKSIQRGASITIIIQLAALPLTLYLFGGFPLWAPVANIIIIPLMPLMVGTAFAAGTTSGLIGTLISFPAGVLLYGVGSLIRLFNHFPGRLELGGTKLVLAAVVSAALVLYLSGFSRKRLFSGIIISALLISAYSVVELRVCSVWFLDVGQGDAVLARCKGSWVLVDSGDYHAGIRGVVPALKHLGVTKLSAVVVTHPHADHAGGLVEIAEHIPVERILVNSCFLESEWSHFQEIVEVVRGEVYICSSLRVLSHGRVFQKLNDNSLVVTLNSNGTRVLITGDIQAQGEEAYTPYLGTIDVLKVAHHGSQTSTSAAFLNIVRPSVAVISCGLGNRFGMPHPAVLDNLDQSDSRVYRTDQSGYIRLVLWPWNRYSILLFTGR